MTSTSKSATADGSLRSAVVLGGNRIPFARANGAYAGASNQDMLTSTLEGLIARFGLQGARLGEVVAGAVMKHAKDFNLTRESVLGTSLRAHTPAHDVQTACATGIETIGGVANKIRLGQIDSGIGGGVDTISDAPLAFNSEARDLFMQLNRARTTQEKIKVALKLRPKHFTPLAPQAGEDRTGLSMGEHQALTTHAWGVTREEQDEIAANSHNNMAEAYEEGFFNDLMTPFRGLDRDNNMRPGSDVETLAKLRIAFGKQFGNEATMTAGNSTPMTDGAAVALLSSEDWATEHNLPILAEFIDYEVAAVDFVNGNDGLLMAPTYAIPKILDRHGLGLDDIDFFEIHEAFAGTVAATRKALADEDYNKNVLGREQALGEIDMEKLNVRGSSLAAGHPFAATGPRIVASLAKMLNNKGAGSLGLISVCAAGGQGAVALMHGR